MTTLELKPCPFCGGSAVINATGGSDERTGYRTTWSVTCAKCRVRLSASDTLDANGWSIADVPDTKQRAISAWNTRTASIPTDARLVTVAQLERVATLIADVTGYADIDDHICDMAVAELRAIIGENGND